MLMFQLDRVSKSSNLKLILNCYKKSTQVSGTELCISGLLESPHRAISA